LQPIAEPALQPFYLVESHVCPSSGDGFKSELKENDSFQTEFVGASIQQCQEWALEKQSQVNFIEQSVIAIADARSTRDDTLSMQYYSPEIEPPPLEDGEFEFGEFGILPRERNMWYDWRVDYKHASAVLADLEYGPIDSVYPTYFGRKEELTDEHGIFNMIKAACYVCGEDPDAPQP
jgi:hypothetical protein